MRVPLRMCREGEALRIDTSPVIALFNVGGEFYAINDRCSHGNASMSEGYLEDDATVECPATRRQFLPENGESVMPARHRSAHHLSSTR
ncbi:3-phenylpropionate dioxygenase ferredoxin subunit [Escherichia coli]|uniref:3-phenylpropionate dioxygenase ferredoxin subunit n=1 Tax=Escherichia coli TaxID=562 RepID=A0A377AGW5_ECOLX|nr:3-phenylpropionate dioxygenase ferredoxin subunit [Escherichia coli]